MSTSDALTIISEIRALRDELRAEVREEIAEQMEPVKAKLDSIEFEAKKTNGRVTGLETRMTVVERWRERIAGGVQLVGKVPVVVACAASIVAIVVAVA